MNFILNLVVSIVESCVVLGCCFVLTPHYVTADAGMNMVVLSSILSPIEYFDFLSWYHHLHYYGNNRQYQDSVYCCLSLSTPNSFCYSEYPFMVLNICCDFQFCSVPSRKLGSLWDICCYGYQPCIIIAGFSYSKHFLLSCSVLY